MVLAAATLRAQSDTTLQKSDTARLAPTVVTVLRTSIQLSKAPFAVAVATRDEIQRGKPGLALDEALATIPGVQVDNRFNYALGERISIRGFGARAQFGVRGVRVLLDGIPLTLADGQSSLNNVDVASVARAEVIRGPASSAYGNASGGVIQLTTDRGDDITQRPSGGELRTVIGDDGLQRVQIATRSVNSEGASAMLSAARLLFDGYREWNDAANDHILFQVGRDLGSTSLSVIGNWVQYDAHNPGALSKTVLDTNRRVAVPANKNTFKTGEQGDQGQIGVTLSRQIRGVHAQLSAHGLQRHVDNPIPQRIVVIDRDAGGARLAFDAAPSLAQRAVRISAGGELQLQRDDRVNYLNVNGTRGADTLDQRERVTNNALFAQTTVDVLPRLLLLVGARYDRINFRAQDHLIGPNNPDDSGERAMSAASPSVGLTWSATTLIDVYANYSTSFETPTTSELANQESGAGGLNPALEPQRTHSAELGVNGRARLAGIAGSYQLSAYDAHVRDALIPFEVASLPGRQYFRNAGSTRNRGIEFGTSIVLPLQFSLRTSYAYTDARFLSYAVTSGGVTTVFDGKRVPGVAANRGDATLSYAPSRTFIDFETRASSSIPVNDTNTVRSPSYVIHSIRAGLRQLRAGSVSFEPHIGVWNLFDTRYNTSVVVNAFGARYFEPGPPRSFYGGVGARF
jgi:iron complex outermembrane receptor protein